MGLGQQGWGWGEEEAGVAQIRDVVRRYGMYGTSVTQRATRVRNHRPLVVFPPGRPTAYRRHPAETSG